ncbi:unnamed protein product [Blepharisma stoltei]|uniref:C2 domain-containing protein n=1 Tax=Blepharisma stoltei TaxID=1481888 RepID=A0AAU9JYP7_9CILI|nr:unnamed protein product [Blepharisma stoltei]
MREIEIETACGKLGIMRGVAINNTYVFYRLGNSEDKTEICEDGGKFPFWNKICSLKGRDPKILMKVYTTHPDGDILIGSSRIDAKEGERWVDIVRDQVGAGQIKIKISIKDIQQPMEVGTQKSATQQLMTRHPQDISLQSPGQETNVHCGEPMYEDQARPPPQSKMSYAKNHSIHMQEESKGLQQHYGPITQHMIEKPNGPYPQPYLYACDQVKPPEQEGIIVPQPSHQDINRDMIYYGGGHMFGPMMMSFQGVQQSPFVDPSMHQHICEDPSHAPFYGMPYQGFNPYYPQNSYQIPQNPRSYQANPYLNGQQGAYMYYQQNPNFK